VYRNCSIIWSKVSRLKDSSPLLFIVMSLFQCIYCKKKLRSKKGLGQHLAQSAFCRETKLQLESIESTWNDSKPSAQDTLKPGKKKQKLEDNHQGVHDDLATNSHATKKMLDDEDDVTGEAVDEVAGVGLVAEPVGPDNGANLGDEETQEERMLETAIRGQTDRPRTRHSPILIL
jgi:hypothetical protein